MNSFPARIVESGAYTQNPEQGLSHTRVMTISDGCRPSNQMRYWFQGVDEGYERELVRVRRFGDVPPAPISLRVVTAVVLLVALHAIALTGAIAAFVLE